MIKKTELSTIDELTNWASTLPERIAEAGWGCCSGSPAVSWWPR